MSWKNYLPAALRRSTGRAEAGNDVDDELLFHLRALVDENMARGMSHEEAWDDAQRRFGSLRRYWIGSFRAARGYAPLVSALLGAVAVVVAMLGWWVWEARLTENKHGLAVEAERAARQNVERGIDLTGRVTDGRGQAIAGADVLVILKTWPGGWYRQDDFAAKSGADGRFKLPALIPPEDKFAVQVAAVKDGYALVSSYQLKEDDDDHQPAPVELRMEDAAALTLVVLDAAGHPVPGASFVPSVRRSASGGEHLLYFQGSEPAWRTADATGQISLRCLRRGDHAEVYVRPPEGDWTLHNIEVPLEGDRIEVPAVETADDNSDAHTSTRRTRVPVRFVSAPLGPFTPQQWAEKLATLKDGNWRQARQLGDALALLPPDEGFAILNENWHRIGSLEARQQLMKSWFHCNHPRQLALYNLGMHDVPEVQSWAEDFLQHVVLQDFSKDFSAYEAWYAANRDKPLPEIASGIAEQLVDEAAQLTKMAPERQDAWLEKLHGARMLLRTVPEARQAMTDAGFVKISERWTAAGLTPGADRAALDRAKAGLATLANLELPEDELRRVVVPLMSNDTQPEIRAAACFALARPEFPWTVDLLLDALDAAIATENPRDVIWTAAMALDQIRNPRAIPRMIAVIEADNTYDTIYGVGYFGLWRITGVEYDKSHDGAWWRSWWEENKQRFPEVSDAKIPAPRKIPIKQASYRLQDDVADVPAEDLRAGDDSKKRYFLIGDTSVAPENGFKLLFVLPGGDGGADFHPFIKRIYKHVLDQDWLIAQPVAPVWDAQQPERIVWPTIKSPYPAAKFSTEAFIAAILKDLDPRVKVDPRSIFMLGWSSGGPPVYATTLVRNSPIVGAFVAMSIYVPSKLPDLDGAEGKAFYLLQSPDDQVTKFFFAERAEKTLSAAGAKVKIQSYAGGHGWRGNIYGMLGDGISWLEQNASPAK